MSKDEIIERMYFDESGYGSISSILKDAKALDPSITHDDIKMKKKTNIETKRQLKGFNSFIADRAYQEFEIDIMFFC